MGAGFNAGAYEKIYQHKDWEKTADEYEVKFAANLYHAPYVQQAAKTALTKLSRMLNAYYDEKPKTEDPKIMQDAAAVAQAAGEVAEEPVEVTDTLVKALLPEGDSATGAGQIGRKTKGMTEDNPEWDAALEQDKANLDAVINGDGNLRERMTMLYNGMFINGGRSKDQIANSHSLKNMMAYIEQSDIDGKSELSGVRLDLLSEMKQRSNRKDVFDTFSIARDLKRYSDKKDKKGTVIGRFFRGLSRAFNAAMSSKFTRKTKAADKRIGLGLQHYNDLGIGLSEREMANTYDPQNENIRWQEGSAWYEMKKRVDSKGMLQTAGPSGTTLRMLAAYKMMGASYKDLLQFRLALIAWMVTSKDHSLYEIMKGSHNAGVTGDEDLTEPATMYMTVDPLPIDVLRQEYAPEHQFPHEKVYKIMLNELRDKRAARAKVRQEKALKDSSIWNMNDDRVYLRGHLKELNTELTALRKSRSAAESAVKKGDSFEREVRSAANALLGKKVITQEEFNYYTSLKKDELIAQNIPGQLAEKLAGVPENMKKVVKNLAQRMNDLAKSIPAYLKGVEELPKLREQVQIFEDQQRYVQGEIGWRRGDLAQKGYESTEENNFALYSKFSTKDEEGNVHAVEEDATVGNAQDIALNVYTTGAFLTMTRGQKYWNGFGKRALSDKRVDESWKTGFGSYENSSSQEIHDDGMEDAIFDQVRISSRMAQDALEERGMVEGKAYVGKTYRGGRLSGYLRGSVGSEITISSLMSSSKLISKASEYYMKSKDKNGAEDSVLIEYDMKGKGAVDISGVSKVQSEGEVLIPANTKFKIVKSVQQEQVEQSGISWKDNQENEKAAGAGNKAGTIFPFSGNVIKLEEVKGPGQMKRERTGEAAELRNEVHERYEKIWEQRMKERELQLRRQKGEQQRQKAEKKKTANNQG